MSLAAIAALVALKRLVPHWPRMLIVVALAAWRRRSSACRSRRSAARSAASRAGFPRPRCRPEPRRDPRRAAERLTFALLGAIELLLSAVVADGMTGRRHRSNIELVAQGIANIGSALFGGFCVTGTIARTATNVRAGAHGPVAGMVHALFLLVFMLVAAPLAGYVPLAALAAVLAVVAWDMVEKPAFAALLATRGDAAVLLVTLGLTLFRDLTEAIVVGFALGAVLFINRMSSAVAVEPEAARRPTARSGGRPGGGDLPHHRGGVLRRRLGGFDGARPHRRRAPGAGDRLRRRHADRLAGRQHDRGPSAKARRRGVAVYLTGAGPGVRRELLTHGARPPLVRYAPTIEAALAAARRLPAATLP